MTLTPLIACSRNPRGELTDITHLKMQHHSAVPQCSHVDYAVAPPPRRYRYREGRVAGQL